MQGVYDHLGRRFRTKKALREAVALAASPVYLQATSLFGDEAEGNLFQDVPNGCFSVVGPDPYHDRRWYATITKRGENVTVK
jgi:hypothetical protein